VWAEPVTDPPVDGPEADAVEVAVGAGVLLAVVGRGGNRRGAAVQPAEMLSASIPISASHQRRERRCVTSILMVAAFPCGVIPA
jgi:hypothetical protein